MLLNEQIGFPTMAILGRSSSVISLIFGSKYFTISSKDQRVADILRRSKKPVLLVVNKVDHFEKFMPDVYEFYSDHCYNWFTHI